MNRNEIPVLKLVSQSGFPIDRWGLAVSPMKWAARSINFDHVLNAGVFADAFKRNIFVIIPESTTTYMGNKASPGLNLIGLKDAALGSKSSEWRIAPLAIAYPLYSSESPAMWRGLVSWAPVQTKEDRKDDERLKAAPILEMLWNKPVRHALLGARIENAAQPVVPLPLLRIVETASGVSSAKQTPLLFFAPPCDELAVGPVSLLVASFCSLCISMSV